jgi:hypothetical protein
MWYAERSSAKSTRLIDLTERSNFMVDAAAAKVCPYADRNSRP